LLISKPKKSDIKRGMTENIVLIPELCSITGLSEEVRSDFHVMKDLAVHTRTNPMQRVGTLRTFLQSINNNPDAANELKGWGMDFGDSLSSFTGRILDQEKITQINSRGGNPQLMNYEAARADWSRCQRGMGLYNPKSLNNWIFVFPSRDKSTAEKFFSALAKVGPPMGIMVNEPTIVELNRDTSQEYSQAIKSSLKNNNECQMVVCLLSGQKKDRYDAIKKLCCLQEPIPSQVVVARTLNKDPMSVCTKIAVQMNCKLGGEVWRVDMPMKKGMVIGIDTYHDSSDNKKSCGAFVASINPSLTRYYSKVNIHMSNEELQKSLSICMQSALKKFHELNQELPDKIIIYRDGVGDGQITSVQLYEVEQIKSGIREMGADYNPKLTVIIVKKRINHRFFAKSSNNYENPAPGTIVDNYVTKNNWYDFFLVAQSVRQGTVTPTHYNVIYDDTGMKADIMQRLTYKMCHLYYNWPGTIRVPAPCLYAHKLAFLTGQSLHDVPSEHLCDKLFYL